MAERADIFATATRTGPADLDATLDELADQLVDGTIDRNKAERRATAAEQRLAADSAAAHLRRKTSSRARQRAWAAMDDVGPDVFDALAAHVDDIVARTAELSDRLPEGVTDAAAAVQAGDDVPAIWAELETLTHSFERIARVVQALRAERVIPGDVAATGREYRIVHRNPDVLHDYADTATIRRYRTQPASLRLIGAIEAGAEPALLHADEITARDRPPQPERQGQVWNGDLLLANRPASEVVKTLDDDALAAEIATQRRVIRDTATMANRSADERDASPAEKDARARYKAAERRLPHLLAEVERREATYAADVLDPAELANKLPRGA